MTTPPTEVTPEELERALQHVRSGKPPGLHIANVAELLKAVELGVVNKNEARRMLGLAPSRATGPSPAKSKAATRRPRTGGKFSPPQ